MVVMIVLPVIVLLTNSTCQGSLPAVAEFPPGGSQATCQDDFAVNGKRGKGPRIECQDAVVVRDFCNGVDSALPVARLPRRF